MSGSKLTKFVSNVPNLADRIDGSPQSTEPKVIVSCQEDSSHVLGLKWDHTNDTLVVSRGTSCAITKSLTQRLVLSLVSKVFDPIGLVAPFTVGARLLLKDIWRVTGQQWDDELPQDIVQRFLVWSADLPKLEAELHAIHEDILHCINSQSRRVKIERLVTKCNEAFMTVVDKNEDLIAFAGKTEDPSALVPSLESYLEAMTTKNDKILTSARNYINSADDKASEFQEPRASIRSRLP